MVRKRELERKLAPTANRMITLNNMQESKIKERNDNNMYIHYSVLATPCYSLNLTNDELN
jgi:hypothetical protein